MAARRAECRGALEAECRLQAPPADREEGPALQEARAAGQPPAQELATAGVAGPLAAASQVTAGKSCHRGW